MSEIDIVTRYTTAEEALPIEEYRFWGRTTIRQLFATIEVSIYGLKQLALAQDQEAGGILTLGEISMLKEEAFQVKDNGVLEASPAKISLLSNLRFAVRTLARVSGIEYALNVQGQEWELLRASIKVRDRLTHPKRLGDLEVTVKEVIAAYMATEWWLREAVSLVNAGKKKRSELTRQEGGTEVA